MYKQCVQGTPSSVPGNEANVYRARISPMTVSTSNFLSQLKAFCKKMNFTPETICMHAMLQPKTTQPYPSHGNLKNEVVVKDFERG